MLSYFGISTIPVLLVFPMQYILIFSYFENSINLSGLFVEIIENKCEGLVRISEMKGDYFVYDEKKHRLIGDRTKKLYQLGDPVTVKIEKADIVKRQLNFTLDEKKE